MVAPDTLCNQGIARAVIQIASVVVIYGKVAARAYMVTTQTHTHTQWRLTPRATWDWRINPNILADLYIRDSEVTHTCNCKVINISIVHYKSYYVHAATKIRFSIPEVIIM